MTDTVTKEERSRIMAQVRGRGNASTELKVVKLFRERHITGWRRHLPLPGKPDFSFPKHKLALFIDGCFWHGCPTHLRMPKSNTEYWQLKVERNKARDVKVINELQLKGWRVCRVWECELRSPVLFINRISPLLL